MAKIFCLANGLPRTDVIVNLTIGEAFMECSYYVVVDGECCPPEYYAIDHYDVCNQWRSPFMLIVDLMKYEDVISFWCMKEQYSAALAHFVVVDKRMDDLVNSLAYNFAVSGRGRCAFISNNSFLRVKCGRLAEDNERLYAMLSTRMAEASDITDKLLCLVSLVVELLCEVESMKSQIGGLERQVGSAVSDACVTDVLKNRLECDLTAARMRTSELRKHLVFLRRSSF